MAFFDRDCAALPPSHWLETLFEQGALNRAERAALLMGRPGKAAPEAGRIVCACFNVGENGLKQAIAQGAASVEALGIKLRAGKLRLLHSRIEPPAGGRLSGESARPVPAREAA